MIGFVPLYTWLPPRHSQAGSPSDLFSGNFPRHPDRARRRLGETKLLIEAVRREVGDQTDIGGLWKLALDMVGQCCHDYLAKPATLVRGHDRDICDLKEAATIADDTTHSDYRVAVHQADAKNRIWEPLFGRLSRKWAEARQVS